MAVNLGKNSVSYEETIHKILDPDTFDLKSNQKLSETPPALKAVKAELLSKLSEEERVDLMGSLKLEYLPDGFSINDIPDEITIYLYIDKEGKVKASQARPLPNYDGTEAGKPKAKELRKYSWFNTFNNPEKVFPDLKPEEIVEEFGKRFAGKSRYCLVNYERGLVEHTDHLHIVVEANNAIAASTLERLFPCKDAKGNQVKRPVRVYDGNKKDKDGNRLTKLESRPFYWLFDHEPTEFGYEYIIAYLTKTGNHAKKEDSVIVPPKEFGEGKVIGFVGSGNGQKGTFDLNKAFAQIKRGVKPRDIYTVDQNWRYQSSHLEKMYTDYLEEHSDTRWTMDVAWLIGASGTRKTSYIEKVEEEFGRPEVYMIDNYGHPFDHYNGQEVLFFDEFRGSKVSFDTFLTWTVGFRGRVDARYDDKAKAWHHIFITSVLMPEECYPDKMGNKDNISQLKRRITRYIYFFRTKDGGYHYKEFPATLSTTQGQLQDAILEEYPDAVFQAFTEDTWEEFLENGGLADFQNLVEKTRATKKRLQQASLVSKEDVAEMIAKVSSKDASSEDELFDIYDETPY